MVDVRLLSCVQRNRGPHPAAGLALIGIALLMLSLGWIAISHAQTCEEICAQTAEQCFDACAQALPPAPVTLTWQTYGEYSPTGPTCLPTQAEQAFGARSRMCSYYRHRIAWLETQPLLAASLTYAVEQRRRLTYSLDTPTTFTRFTVEHYGYAMRATEGYALWIEDFDTGERLTPTLRLTGATTEQSAAVTLDLSAGRRLACAWGPVTGLGGVYAYPVCRLAGVNK